MKKIMINRPKGMGPKNVPFNKKIALNFYELITKFNGEAYNIVRSLA